MIINGYSLTKDEKLLNMTGFRIMMLFCSAIIIIFSISLLRGNDLIIYKNLSQQ